MHNPPVIQMEELKNNYVKISPLCPSFGVCGGCSFQDLSYQDELEVKYIWLKNLFQNRLGWDRVEPVVASPQEYHYRHRLDLKLARFKDGHCELGFTLPGRKRMMEIAECVIARQELSQFIPQLKLEAVKQLPPDYREANITVRSGNEKKVYWGGIGRRSLQMEEKDYLWTEIQGRKIFYSLDTFFQANLFILPKLMEILRGFPIWSRDKLFFDLYGGVGLFGLNVADRVKEVYLIEENKFSVKLAQYNIRHHQLDNFFVIEGRLEEKLWLVLENLAGSEHIAMIDPPRAGLSKRVVEMLNGVNKFKHLIYLSCNPETLIENCVELTQEKWQIKQIIPFDFFPRTRHLETLVVLEQM